MEVLKIENIEKIFGDTKILSGFSLNINKGEIVCITGKSGAGKTTILRLINQLEKLDGGNINICGQYLVKEYKNEKAIYNNKNILKNINLNVGMVFQDFNLFPYLSVIQNITITLRKVLKISKEEAERKALELLDKLEMKERAKYYPYQLSGGQRQRVAIARTLSVDPKIICFDEPTSSLDYELKKEIINIIKQLSKEGRTIIIVTHELDLINEISTRLVKL